MPRTWWANPKAQGYSHAVIVDRHAMKHEDVAVRMLDVLEQVGPAKQAWTIVHHDPETSVILTKEDQWDLIAARRGHLPHLHGVLTLAKDRL